MKKLHNLTNANIKKDILRQFSDFTISLLRYNERRLDVGPL